MKRRGSMILAAGAAALLALPAFGETRNDKGDKAPPRPVVLHIGDSFVGSGFSQSLKPRFEALGARYVSVAQTSAYTTTLPRQIKLESLITQHKPALIILTIGANEMRMPDPEEHAHAVVNLTKMISTTSCIWALPPKWDEKEPGILGIMKREAGPCKLHDPGPIAASIPRGPDKMHPSPKGGQMWADHFWSWLMDGKAEGEKPWASQEAASGDKK